MQQKPRIALVHYSYPPVVGGVESIISTHAEQFCTHGYPTSVICGAGETNNPLLSFHVIPELRSLSNSNPKIAEQLYAEKHFSPDFFQLVEYIFQQIEPVLYKSDIIIAHNIFSLSFNPAIGYALLRFKRNYPHKQIVSWTHDFELKDSNGTRTQKEFVNSELSAFIYKQNPLLYYVAISPFLKKHTFIDMLAFKETDVTVISNGINIEQFMSFDPSSLAIIHKYALLGRSPLLVLPSKILKHKNIILCLQVLKKLKEKGNNPFLIITAKYIAHNLVDSHKQYEIVAQTIHELELEDNVLILPDELEKITIRNIKDFYSISDLVLLLSSYENFGLPLIEAGITKTPILCSSLEVFRQIAQEYALYTDIQTPPEKIADQIMNYLIANNNSAFFTKVKKIYSVESIFENQLLPYLQQIMRK